MQRMIFSMGKWLLAILLFASISQQMKGQGKAVVQGATPIRLASDDLPTLSADQQPQVWSELNGGPGPVIHTTPEEDKIIAAKLIQELQNATWTPEVNPSKSTESPSNSCYENYKGIQDPVKAKEAWYQDGKNNPQ